MNTAKQACRRHLDDIDRSAYMSVSRHQMNVELELFEVRAGRSNRSASAAQTAKQACRRHLDDIDRSAHVSVSRKNGKSLLGATVGMYMLTVNGEPGADVETGIRGVARRIALKMSQLIGLYKDLRSCGF
jgi:phage terminase large subunit-like protein